ncbi:MAG TPA: (2Fe-2S)-binding protein [Amycolatopsis sp.]|nr:(2Fe-2S)-binding protein [Amycolatopsis sp.]
MYACICAAVTVAEVHRCIDGGACTVEEIGDQCEAGTGCGGCHERLETMIGAQVRTPDAA